MNSLFEMYLKEQDERIQAEAQTATLQVDNAILKKENEELTEKLKQIQEEVARLQLELLHLQKGSVVALSEVASTKQDE